MTLLAPETIDLASLPFVPISQRHRFPNISAIYFVLGKDDEVLYIGRAQSLCLRWQAHHRLSEFLQDATAKIAWHAVTDVYLLPLIEDALIQYYNPYYNGRRLRNRKWKQLTVRLPADQLCEIKYYLRLEGKSFTAYCNELIHDYVERKDRERRAVVSP